MSNSQVGTVFEKVIQEVCDSSQVDFEESGVDQKTLLDLRQVSIISSSVSFLYLDEIDGPGVVTLGGPAKSGEARSGAGGSAYGGTPDYEAPFICRRRYPLRPGSRNFHPSTSLISLGILPPPQAAPQLPPQATVPSNAPRPPPQPQHVPPPVSLPQSVPAPVSAPMAPAAPVAAAMSGPRIKTEPGTNGQAPMPPMHNAMPPNVSNPQMARERAAQQLTSKYGASAAGSVSQLQSAPTGPQSYPQHVQMHHQANGQVPQIKSESSYSSMGPGQTDGSDDALADWKAEVTRRREAAQSGQADHLLREYLKHQMTGLEAGGLMRPLAEQESSATVARRAALVAPLHRGNASSVLRMPGQYDGVDDGPREEADEDAINSDLDDPEDDMNDEHDADESEGQVMLCTYDKVQRVKNKWKCTLKDGILTTGGKEYVFHKGQGEFEW
ncbi:hypothetical protein N7462_005874 [Penicillium macrosclerotiorum]|uniref:uncharacterized protein n=1 Tax=Penicillium macrosclerotiorum TaxID=303699 RepID=UPI002548E0E8|nr:uncharacterized protein N7462_005874 [Penicillium macrosclerotiorum]KAJ5682709.1 hypothetical protein N7462_005874 [Penicillium macrosclerotiorum]